MSPAQWVALALLVIGVCWLAGLCIEIANGSKAERKEYREKRAKDDMEAMLKGEP